MDKSLAGDSKGLWWLPVTASLKNYTREDLVADFIAGITLGLTLIPQSIAYSSLAGVPPQYGLNSAFIGCFVYVVFGSIKEVSIGPTSLMALLTAEYTSNLTPEFVVALCFFVGCVEFLMGIFRLGFLMDFISSPVTSGFQTATSVIIIVSQMPGVLGIRFRASGSVDTVCGLWTRITQTKLSGDFSLAAGCIVFLLLMRKVRDLPVRGNTPSKRLIKKALWFASISRNFLVVVISAGIAYYYESTVGKVPFRLSRGVEPGLPPFRFPNLTPTVGNHTYTVTEVVSELGSGIAIIPTVAVLANVAIAKAFTSGKSINVTQEMLTLSLCNILGSFVQAMPTCGAFTRSAVASASGVRTPIAGLFSGILSMLALTFLTPYFHLIPRATLSAVLITAVVFLIDYQILLPLWRTNKWELSVVVVTFVSCMVVGVELGMLMGVVVSACHLVYLWASPSLAVEIRKVYRDQTPVEYSIVTPAIGMFFPAVSVVSSKLMEQGSKYPVVVLNCTYFTSLDITAAKTLCTLAKDFEKRGQHLIFYNLSSENAKIFRCISCSKMTYCQGEVELESVATELIPLGETKAMKMIESRKGVPETIPLMDQEKQNSAPEEKKMLT